MTKTLQALIFKTNETAINGLTMTVDQMAVSVAAYNASAHSGLVVFDDYPGNPHGEINLDQVAATSKLHMEGQLVIATITLLDTPMGRIAQTLSDSAGIQVCPVTTVLPDEDELKLNIRHLIIPQHNMGASRNSDLQKVKNWVNKEDYWPMFQLIEHK